MRIKKPVFLFGNSLESKGGGNPNEEEQRSAFLLILRDSGKNPIMKQKKTRGMLFKRRLSNHLDE